MYLKINMSKKDQKKEKTTLLGDTSLPLTNAVVAYCTVLQALHRSSFLTEKHNSIF